jgi:hypothetical protein
MHMFRRNRSFGGLPTVARTAYDAPQMRRHGRAGSVSIRKGTLMKKAAAVMVGAIAFMTMLAGTAFAGETETPEPTTVVEGAGGGTAFTGGDASTAAIVAVALVAVGLVALFVARRRTATTS